MDLILWRHAEAPPGYPDAERPLSAEGRRQAEAMAAWLKPRLPAGLTLYVSPALRAQETARTLSASFGTEDAVGTAATPEQILQKAGWPYGDETVVVVGHQPTLGAAAALALTGRAYPWALSPGSLWWLARKAQGTETVVRAVVTPELLR
jgi:phosphohistidine phosphatase